VRPALREKLPLVKDWLGDHVYVDTERLVKVQKNVREWIMAFSKVGDEELLSAATEVFRARGYEGASLSQLSEATGLEKASLYHRFPGGKAELALAVVRRGDRWFQEHVFAPLAGDGSPAKRLKLVGWQLRGFYGDGLKSCTLESLSLPGGGAALEQALRSGLLAWLEAFAKLAQESGLPPAVARARAEQAVIEIEGSLVLARVLQDNKPFLRVIGRLPDLLLRM
jgi:TetR/AcrR family transcriptional regulator, lmrAB and yxaGH operons repressor